MKSSSESFKRGKEERKKQREEKEKREKEEQEAKEKEAREKGQGKQSRLILESTLATIIPSLFTK